MYGDLLLTPEQEKQLSTDVHGDAVAQGFKEGARLWPYGIVPYQLDSQLSKCACLLIELVLA